MINVIKSEAVLLVERGRYSSRRDPACESKYMLMKRYKE